MTSTRLSLALLFVLALGAFGCNRQQADAKPNAHAVPAAIDQQNATMRASSEVDPSSEVATCGAASADVASASCCGGGGCPEGCCGGASCDPSECGSGSCGGQSCGGSCGGMTAGTAQGATRVSRRE